MCGIAGFLASGAAATTSDAARGLLEIMIGALAHRGPDGNGYHVDNPVALAHARLAIIDLATGTQPLCNEDGSIWVVLNGEIFNYLELRADLVARGHQFRSRSDTEVIVHLYEEHGDECVTRLNGQFAFALWDRRRRRLLLARDRVGIRPLFYTRARGAIWFASEMKALLAVLPERCVLSAEAIAQAFTFWAPLDPICAFDGVSSLPPGHLLALEHDGRETLRCYWDWQFPDACDSAPVPSIEQCAAELRQRLAAAVRLQLRSDVPVGAYLSGGLDSAGLVALMRSESSAPLHTFSVSFTDAEYDESEHQQMLVRHLQTAHTALRCARSDIGAVFPRLVWHAEAPLLRTAGAPLLLLAAAVRAAEIKVVLSGEGADEVFAGYDVFREAKVRRFWARQPESRWRPALLGRLYGYLRHSPVASRAMSEQFFAAGMRDTAAPGYAQRPRWRTTQRAWRFFSPELRSQLQGMDPVAGYLRRLPSELSRWSPLAADQYVEAHTLLSPYLLSSQGDRLSMAHSVEGRVPYLDHTLIEWAAALPPRLKIRGLKEKYILRRALAGLLPAQLLQRSKQPYRAPDHESFFQDGKPLEYVAELLEPKRVRAVGLFDAAAVQQLLEKCRFGRALGAADNQSFVGILSVMLLDHTLVRGAQLPRV